jgi:hypothetical protein
MGAVDWSWFLEDCPDCGLQRDVAQYRVFTIPVRSENYDTGNLLQLADAPDEDAPDAAAAAGGAKRSSSAT